MDKELIEKHLKSLNEKMVAFQSVNYEKYGDHNIGYDLGSQQLVILDENQDMLEAFPFIIIGSHCAETDTFVWGWANDELMGTAKSESRSLIDLSEKLEANEFTAPFLTFKKDDGSGYYPSPVALPKLLSIAVDHLGAITLERFNFGKTDCYVAVLPPLKSG